MNIELNKKPNYLYRGRFYQKNISTDCFINLSQYQIDRPVRDLPSPTLKYRSVTYQLARPECQGKFSDWAWVQTYRSTDYLNCSVELNLHGSNS